MEHQCRICFSNEEEQGNRLFSPCLCKGSVKYVHQECLNQWRTSSPGTKTFYECELCHYRYQFIRLKWARYLQYRWLPYCITTFLLVVLLSMGSLVRNPRLYQPYMTNSYYEFMEWIFSSFPVIHSLILFTTFIATIINLTLVILCIFYEVVIRYFFPNLRPLPTHQDKNFGFTATLVSLNAAPFAAGMKFLSPLSTIITAYLTLYLFSLPFLFLVIVSDLIKISLCRAELRILEVVRSHED